MRTLNPWADGPWPLLETPSKTMDVSAHAAIFIADDMAHVHNVIIRAINSIYLQAPFVRSPADISDFLFFIKCFCDMVELHHSAEETFLFPSIRTLAGDPALFEHSVEQHNAFNSGLHKLHDYSLSGISHAYSGTDIRIILESFVPALGQHLVDEIDELLALQDLDSSALLKIHVDSEKAKTPEKADEMFPLFFGLVDKTYEGGIHSFPAATFFVAYVVHFWYAREHKGAWRFLPCDFWGQPRPLQFID